ncbi:B12-binding domain-containing radical SAM protein [Thermodesulfobacteriota bacterium]
MIILIEPVSKNIDMYVPAYPLPIMEIASFVKSRTPETDIEIISIPMDYGLPLTPEGREHVYEELINDLSETRPKGVGISCTAIAQAEEVILLCELIKESIPDISIFIGGYFPTLYYEEIFSRTSAIDLIVIGEGEIPTLKIVECLERDEDPKNEDIPNLAWVKDGRIRFSKQKVSFDLNEKALINLELLKNPKAYDILPYAFSRGCPYHCNFCMEDHIRPIRKKVPSEIIQRDLSSLSNQSSTHTLLISDALFKSFDLFPLIRSFDMKINFETRCDIFDSTLIPHVADICGMLAIGFESASFNTLKRMNKVRDRAHYKQYISNTIAIFKEAVRYEIPIMVFMIAGYPGDTEEDLKESLTFANRLSQESGPGGHVFKIGECRAYPKTKIYDVALSSSDVVFDNDGVFGNNIIRQPSKELSFETILDYMREIFNLSNNTHKFQSTLLNIMPFFRLPAHALMDDIIPGLCYRGRDRIVFDVHGESLLIYKKIIPGLMEKHKELMSGQRSTRDLSF